MKQVNFNYRKERQLQQIVITIPDRQPEEITYTYDTSGRMATRSISRGKVPYMLEEYTYDESGKISEVHIYNAAMPEMAPLLRSTFTYYTLEEI